MGNKHSSANCPFLRAKYLAKLSNYYCYGEKNNYGIGSYSKDRGVENPSMMHQISTNVHNIRFKHSIDNIYSAIIVYFSQCTTKYRTAFLLECPSWSLVIRRHNCSNKTYAYWLEKEGASMVQYNRSSKLYVATKAQIFWKPRTAFE